MDTKWVCQKYCLCPSLSLNNLILDAGDWLSKNISTIGGLFHNKVIRFQKPIYHAGVFIIRILVGEHANLTPLCNYNSSHLRSTYAATLVVPPWEVHLWLTPKTLVKTFNELVLPSFTQSDYQACLRLFMKQLASIKRLLLNKLNVVKQVLEQTSFSFHWIKDYLFSFHVMHDSN